MLTSISVYRDICACIEIDENNREKIEELEKCISLTELIIPVLIRAGDYQYQEESVLGGMLDCIIGGPTSEIFNEWITEIRRLNDRRITILVDAVDEIDYLQREFFLNSLNSLYEMLNHVDLLVTCRPIDRAFLERSRLFRGIEEWRLEPFETEPGFAGNTAQGATKPATVETGAVVYVPLFVNQGDVIKIDTRTGEYLSRV